MPISTITSRCTFSPFSQQPTLIHQGTVNVPGLDKPILLVGRESMNRSVNGDVVVVEIFPKAQWKAPGAEVLDQEGT